MITTQFNFFMIYVIASKNHTENTKNMWLGFICVIFSNIIRYNIHCILPLNLTQDYYLNAKKTSNWFLQNLFFATHLFLLRRTLRLWWFCLRLLTLSSYFSHLLFTLHLRFYFYFQVKLIYLIKRRHKLFIRRLFLPWSIL